MNNEPPPSKTTEPQSKPAEDQLSNALARAMAVYIAWKAAGLLEESPKSQSEK